MRDSATNTGAEADPLGDEADRRGRQQDAGIAHGGDDAHAGAGRHAGLVAAGRKGDRHHVGDAEPAEGEGRDGQPRRRATVRRPACRRPRSGSRRASSSPRRSGCARRRRGSASAPSRRQKPAKAKPAVARSAAEFLLQIERCPVEHRAFRNHREQRDQADEIDQSALRGSENFACSCASGRSSATRSRQARSATIASATAVTSAACGEMTVVLDGDAAERRRRRSRRGSRSRARTT